MTPEKMLAMFERQYLEGKAPIDAERSCAGFADWLATAWEQLGGDERVLLMSIGSVLWREGYNRRAAGATRDPW